MLTEQFLASIGTALPAKTASTSSAKDSGIFLHEFRPLLQQQQRAVFKKSATPTNGLAVSESHIFAAQADKGVVHVYSREKGNQEAIVPFPEKISAITLACDDTVLVIGSVEGRIFLWETATGRQVSNSQAHLQAVTALAVDTGSQTLLSASKDSTIHVWSIPALLSFGSTNGTSPLRTFTAHNSEVSSIALPQGAATANFAVSVAKDRICLVWDYRAAALLRTYLLPSVPLCVALDPAGRAVYVGHEDGSIQQLTLLAGLDSVQNATNPTEPLQPPTSTRWLPPDASAGQTLSLCVSYDGSFVVSGHQSGSMLSWDVGRRTFSANLAQIPLPGPVNNLLFLPTTGHSVNNTEQNRKLKINEITKPKFGAFDTSDIGAVPGNYSINAQLSSELASHESNAQRDFQTALTAPVLPAEWLEEGLQELASWGKGEGVSAQTAEGNDDFVAFDGEEAHSAKSTLEQENANLKAQLDALVRVQQKSFQRMEKLSEEKRALLKRDQRKLQQRNGKQSEGLMEEDSDDSGE